MSKAQERAGARAVGRKTTTHRDRVRLTRRRACGSRCRLSTASALVLVFALGSSLAAQEAPPPGSEPAAALVHLRDVDASILQDIRYAGSNNFTGRPVPGYAAAECLLLRDAAEALARVQNDLRKHRLSLKVYDCYRPRQAVQAFRAWVSDPTDYPSSKRFRPTLEKSQLISLGYIAAVSRHSRGDTVDLTLVALPAKRVPPFRQHVAYGACNGPPETRAPDNSVDMGTSFDCFDPLSHTQAAGLTPIQLRWRQVLTHAMAQHGFQNYSKEWWHFTYMPERRGRSFDVPVTSRSR